MYNQEYIKLHHENFENGIINIPENSVDIICIDPPYKYLKNQKLEVDFNEEILFNNSKRILRNDGFIILFGRGESFYRWNYMLGNLGFKFKEEFIWDKGHCTSPLMNVSRVHETVSIWSKGKGVIKKIKIPYVEMKSHDLNGIITDINRLKTTFKNTKSLNAILDFLENNKIDKSDNWGKSVAISSNITKSDRSMSVMQGIQNGMNEKTIIRTDRIDNDRFTKYNTTADKRKSGDRCVNAFQSMITGMNEKSIIQETRDHYDSIHPTQKPVRLITRLLQLVCNPGDKVVDFFSGSGSTAISCLDLNIDFEGWELDKEYFDNSVKRISRHPVSYKLF